MKVLLDGKLSSIIEPTADYDFLKSIYVAARTSVNQGRGTSFEQSRSNEELDFIFTETLNNN